MSAALDAVRRALDARPDPGRDIAVWVRDDDAVTWTPALAAFLDQLEAAGGAPLLAVIPEALEASLGDALGQRAMGSVWAGVHGSEHRNRAGPDEKKSEYPAVRPGQEVMREQAVGLARLLSGLPDGVTLPVFVPPWNRISEAAVACLHEAGYLGLSTFAEKHMSSATPGIMVRNTHIDVIDWSAGRVGKNAAQLTRDLVEAIASGSFDRAVCPLGILTHHLDHDAAVVAWLHVLAECVAREPRLVWAAPPDVFGLVKDGDDWRRGSQ